MRIAICDDDPNDLAALSHCLKNYNANGLDIYEFDKSTDLLLSIKAVTYDIVFLDIEMPAPNGYETALSLKKLAPNSLIIFLTQSMEYTLRGYGLVFRYLTKPIDRRILYSVLDTAIKEVTANRFVFTAEGTARIIRLEEIYYIEVFNHYIILHTVDREYPFRATLKDVLSQLPAGYFGMPHQSYIVNFAHIKTATSSDLHLTNGSTIPISRRRQKDFTEQIYLYLGR